MGAKFPPALIFVFCSCLVATQAILYHRDNELRRSISLDGLWRFSLSNPNEGSTTKWSKKNLTDDLQVLMMPVPSSYNDISTDWDLREHVGSVWYQRQFFVPKSWADKKIWVRFSSVCYSAQVWINGQLAVDHTIGHLPFQADVTALVQLGGKNTIVVEVDNTLSSTTIPQGSSYKIDSGRTKYSQNFDFFNYAGIDRPVILYTTPNTHIDDVTVSTDIDGTTGVVNYQVFIDPPQSIAARVTLLDQSGAEVASSPNLEGFLTVANANLWWPFLMDPNPGYLYTLQVELISSSGPTFDVYKLPVGIRTITWDSSRLMINNRPVYLRGFGRHEDSDIRGKGLDLPLIIRDYNLIKWIGANAYRASHYPYADEILDLADQLGIMIIEESPAIGTDNYSDQLLQNHQRALTEMIQRDKNRPSVIMWVPSNAPVENGDSDNYYRDIISHIKSLDSSRPVSVVNYNRGNSAQPFGDIQPYCVSTMFRLNGHVIVLR